MARVCIPLQSRLRNSTYRCHTNQRSEMRRILLLALAALYAGDYVDRVMTYKLHRANPRAFFAACVDGSIEPCPNQVQELISQLCPRNTHLNLYMAVNEEKTLTHYMCLVKDDDSGLWRLDSPRLLKVRSNRLPKDGIKAYWNADYTPTPEIACELDIHFSRIVGGGTSIHEMVMEIADSRELQYQLTHCAMVCELFSNLSRNTVTVRCSPGKAVFRVQYHDGADSGFVTPYSFHPVLVNPYAPRVEKPNVIVWGNASVNSLLVKQVPRSIQPQIRNAQEYAFEPGDSEGDFVKDVLLSRLLPYVAILRNGTVDIFGLSYNPDEQRTIVTAYTRGRRAESFTMIPMFAASENKGYEKPSARSLELVR